jgi:mono/diheme cytochrome c family protein
MDTMMKGSAVIGAAVLALAVSATGCGVVPQEVQTDVAVAKDALDAVETLPPIFLEQGWSDTVRTAFYTTSQGSRMLPYSWFLSLEEATSRRKFKVPGNMRRMGFLVDEGPSNPDNLPVGFAKDEHPTRGAAIGLTCAACHTGQVEFAGKTIRIDGGQSLGDLEQLQSGLLAALEATLTDPLKFARFAEEVVGESATTAQRADLRAQVEQSRDWWAARVARSRGLSPHGPSRTDAFTIIGNEVVCVLLNVRDNCVPAVAPTQFPFLWNTPDFDWAQYNSSVHSPIGRNVGEVTGVFAEASLNASGGVDSTANLHNLHALENWLKLLQPPKWPADVLGAVDLNLAAEGEALYAETCAGCHTEDPQPRTAPNAFGVTFAKVNFATPLSVLGTDRTAALSFATRRADPGPWRPIAEAQGLIGPDGKVAAAALLSISGTMIIQKFFAINGFTDLQKLSYLGFRQSQTPTVAQLTTYKARPLHGIALTAPFLHNGSVPSLYDVLLPAEQRTKQFHVGNRNFDPVKVGYSTERESNTVPFDTNLLGNSNAGHEYGTHFNHLQRMAVVEYLKTL